MELISIREYARRLGINEKAVRKARDTGKISAGIDESTGKIIYEKANEEWGALHLKADVPTAIQLTKSERQELKIGTVLPGEEVAMIPLVDDNFVELQRKNIFIKTQIDILKKRQLEGELVSKAETDKQLFEIAKEIRVKFESLSDRCIDDILAASDNRNESHGILATNIKNILTEVSEILSKGI